MERDLAVSFLRWVAQATDSELQQRLIKLQMIAHHVEPCPVASSDYRWMLKNITSELDARSQVEILLISRDQDN